MNDLDLLPIPMFRIGQQSYDTMSIHFHEGKAVCASRTIQNLKQVLFETEKIELLIRVDALNIYHRYQIIDSDAGGITQQNIIDATRAGVRAAYKKINLKTKPRQSLPRLNRLLAEAVRFDEKYNRLVAHISVSPVLEPAVS